MNPDVDVVTS